MLSHGTSSREVFPGIRRRWGNFPIIDRTPSPDPKYPASIIPNTLIIPHTSAYGKIGCPPPAGARRAAIAGEATRSRMSSVNRLLRSAAAPGYERLGARAANGTARSTGRSNALHPLATSREPGRWQRLETEGRMTS